MKYEWKPGATVWTYADPKGIMAAQIEFDGLMWTAYDLTRSIPFVIGRYGLVAEAQHAVEKHFKPNGKGAGA